MIEKLLNEYMRSTGNITYYDGTLEGISTAGDMVIFQERSVCGNYTEQHMIPLLEILAWVYSKGLVSG